eukprot:337180_1
MKTYSNWRTPTLMNAPMYLLLFFLTVVRSCIVSTNDALQLHPQHHDIQQNKSYDSTQVSSKYSQPSKDIPLALFILAAIADVEGNVLLLTAYEYTTITSVSLLDCFCIPMVMVWGILIFGRKYKCSHVMGIAICLSGMSLLVYTDAVANKSENHGTNPVLGDMLVLCGCVCYSISNSFTEYAVKHYQSIWKYLRMIGLFGCVVTVVQGLIWEHHALLHHNSYSIQSMGCLAGYIVSLSLYYMAIPIMMQYSSAVVFNLSLLSADFWAVLAAVFLFSVTLNYLYFVAFVTIIGGVIWYN